MKQEFIELLQKIGFDQDKIIKEWFFLQKSYQEKKRFYHNLNHIEDMLSSFSSYKAQIDKPEEILFALFYHDIIYKATSNKNELKSAQYALKILPHNISMNKDFIFEAIISTQKHLSENFSIQWLLDFDLKILGSDSEIYEDYVQQIRKEYAIYPDFLYKPGRKKALEHFLYRDQIYFTQVFYEKYEKQARENILREIELIGK